MKFDREAADTWFPARLIPVALPLVVVFIQIAAHPSYGTNMVGFDFVFAGISFDIWAIQTLISGRMATFGGVFSMPSQAKEKKQAIQCEWTRWAIVFFAHLILLFVMLKYALANAVPNTLCGPQVGLSLPLNIAGVALGLPVPGYLLFPTLLPKRSFYGN